MRLVALITAGVLMVAGPVQPDPEGSRPGRQEHPMRKCLVACLGLALVLAGGLIALLRPRYCPVNRAAFEKVEAGMTQAEAEAVLGGPPGDYRTRPRPRWLPPAPVTPGVWEDAPKVERWEGDDGTAVVAFRPAGTVLRAEFDEPPPFRPGLLELARWRLDKMRAAWGR